MKSINKRMWLPSFLISMLALAILIAGPVERQAYSAQLGERTFPETGKAVGGRFLEYWDKNGGLPQQGYPISTEMQERSDIDGKTYTVQYFERAVFELHPENKAPNDILLSLLGVFLYKQKYPSGAPGQTPDNQTGSRLFQETGKRVGGVFLDYWTRNGGLLNRGTPSPTSSTKCQTWTARRTRCSTSSVRCSSTTPKTKRHTTCCCRNLGRFATGPIASNQLPPLRRRPHLLAWSPQRHLPPLGYLSHLSTQQCEPGLGA